MLEVTVEFVSEIISCVKDKNDKIISGDHEKIKKQRISISLSLKAFDNLNEVNECIKNVVSYEHIIKKLKKIISSGHIELLETLGEKIFEMCFEDKRVLSVRLKLEKLDVFKETKSVGIEISRERNDFTLNGKKSNLVKKIYFLSFSKNFLI